MKRFIFLSLFFSLTVSSMVYAKTNLLITGDIRGEIKPCGCSELGDLGGIERMSTYLKDNQDCNTLWLDTGNYSQEPTPQGLLKNRLILQFFLKRKLTAILPGPREFFQGERTFKDFPLPYVLTNAKSKIENTKTFIQAGKTTVFGYLSPSYLYMGKYKPDILTGVDEFLKKSRASKALKQAVLLFRGSKITVTTCKKCHVGSHSPPFSFDQYWKKIQH